MLLIEDVLEVFSGKKNTNLNLDPSPCKCCIMSPKSFKLFPENYKTLFLFVGAGTWLDQLIILLFGLVQQFSWSIKRPFKKNQWCGIWPLYNIIIVASLSWRKHTLSWYVKYFISFEWFVITRCSEKGGQMSYLFMHVVKG